MARHRVTAQPARLAASHAPSWLRRLPLAAPFVCAVSLHESESPALAGVRGGARGSYASAALEAELSRVIGDYDLVHVEGYFLVPHVPAGTDRSIVLVEENIEYLLDAHAVRAYGYAAGGRASNTRRAELAAWSRAAKIVVLTEEDASVARQAVGDDRLSVVANGYGHTGLARQQPGADPTSSSSGTTTGGRPRRGSRRGHPAICTSCPGPLVSSGRRTR